MRVMDLKGDLVIVADSDVFGRPLGRASALRCGAFGSVKT